MSAATPPWEPCPDCDGAGVTPCGRFTSEQSAPDYPCGTCGATGLKRIRDPEGHGVIRMPHAGKPTANHQRFAETILQRFNPPHLCPSNAHINLLADYLADFEAFIRSPPA